MFRWTQPNRCHASSCITVLLSKLYLFLVNYLFIIASCESCCFLMNSMLWINIYLLQMSCFFCSPHSAHVSKCRIVQMFLTCRKEFNIPLKATQIQQVFPYILSHGHVSKPWIQWPETNWSSLNRCGKTLWTFFLRIFPHSGALISSLVFTSGSQCQIFPLQTKKKENHFHSQNVCTATKAHIYAPGPQCFSIFFTCPSKWFQYVTF